jgi:hypothetical protein
MDLVNMNRALIMKRYEHQKSVALTQIQAREIRIMELEEEIVRCRIDMEGQNKIIVNMDRELGLQRDELAKEAAAKAEADAKKDGPGST